jgi:hypothetical protein
VQLVAEPGVPVGLEVEDAVLDRCVRGRPPATGVTAGLAGIATPPRRFQPVAEIVKEDSTPLAAGSACERQRGGERRNRADRDGDQNDPDGNAAVPDGCQSRNLIALLTCRRRNWSAVVSGSRSKR